MARLEELTKGAVVRGIVPSALATVVDVKWIGTVAIEITYKDASGRLGSELLYRDREPTLEIAEAGRPWSFDGDALTDSRHQAFGEGIRPPAEYTDLGRLDAFASNPAVDAITVEYWCDEPADETQYFDDAPSEPDQDLVPNEAISAVFNIPTSWKRSLASSTLQNANLALSLWMVGTTDVTQ